MNPRLLVVCLGGLAGAGAVCCDLDAETEMEFTPDGESVEEPAPELQADAPEAVH